MKTEIRTFVAIKIHPKQKLLEQINAFRKQFSSEKINWVPEDNHHLTIRFIGNTTREQLYKLVDAFEVSSADCPKFQIELKGNGYFKSNGKPRAFFVKISESEPLRALAGKIEKDVSACGFYAGLKPFRPHITIGRIKHLEYPDRFISFVDGLASTKYQDVKVSEFVLYQSILHAKGPIYKPIKTFKLL